MGYVSTGISDRFSALLVSLMASRPKPLSALSHITAAKLVLFKPDSTYSSSYKGKILLWNEIVSLGTGH